MTFIDYSEPKKAPIRTQKYSYGNFKIEPFNFKDKIVVFKPQVQNKIAWESLNFVTGEKSPVEAEKPEKNDAFTLRSIIEMDSGAVLVVADTAKADNRFMIFNLKATGGDK